MAETQTIVSHSEGGHVSALDEPSYVTGVIYKVEHNEPNKYKVLQVQEQEHFLGAPKNIDITILGIVRIVGWFDPSSLAIDIAIYVVGIKVGEFVGDVKKGIEITVDGIFVKGTIKIFTKNGKDVWVKLALTVLGKEYSGEWQIYPLIKHGSD